MTDFLVCLSLSERPSACLLDYLPAYLPTCLLPSRPERLVRLSLQAVGAAACSLYAMTGCRLAIPPTSGCLKLITSPGLERSTLIATQGAEGGRCRCPSSRKAQKC